MFRFLLKRIRYSLLVLLGVVSLVFFLFNVLPGDPARLVMGERTDKASIENARKEMNLDKPLFTPLFSLLERYLSISSTQKIRARQVQFCAAYPLLDESALVLEVSLLG